MFSSTSRGLSLAVLITSVTAAFSPSAKNNVAVYWGQGPNQQRLLETCKSSAVDIVNIGFVNAFPDNSPGAYPGTNFGNACGDVTYTVNGVSTLLKSSCPLIGSDIVECQNTYGKKIFLSFGGAYPQTYYIANDNSANSFADFVWGAFGPSTSAWTSAGKPRPFGNAVVDGFDFDIESNMTSPPKDSSGNAITDYKSRGYATMINRLKNTQFPKDTSKSYYISGAPQCPLPDEHLAGPIANAWFDMLFVQFYNNPSCSGRAAINYAAGDSFLKWTQTPSKNSNVKIYFGLPASTSAVAPANAGDYLTQPEVKDIVTRFSPNAKWGGIMLWESTYARNNIVCDKDYTTWSKNIVTAVTSGQTIDTDISKCSTIPSPIQPGVISTCNKYEKTNPGGAKCDKFAARIGVSTAQLYAWNSVLGSNGENCGSKFVGDTYYCVGVTPPPGSTQAGITPYCTKYEKANAGGSCPVFANRVGITTSQLYAWNSVLGNSGQNCAGSFWGDTYYCVAVSPAYPVPATQPTTTGAAPAPGPTQSGIISTCSTYLKANQGGTCPVFASRAGISTAQLYAWNSVLGNNGQNCASSFWGDTYYCVGVRSNKAKRDMAAEITGYAPSAYAPSPYAAPSAYGSATSELLSTASSELAVPTPEPYLSTSETLATLSTISAALPSSYNTAQASSNSSSTSPAPYVAVPTQNPIVPINSTLIIIGTTRVAPVPYPTSAGTTSYGSSNGTVVATGTGASKPAQTTAMVHPYTGAGRKTEVSFGLAAVFVGASLFFM
jgi:chitinase